MTGRFSDATVVTAPELTRIARQGSLMDSLEWLRPEWLTSRAATPRVSVDGSPPTKLSLLRTIPASTVGEVRLGRSSSSVGHAAIAANGDLIVGNLIVVTSRRGGRSARDPDG